MSEVHGIAADAAPIARDDRSAYVVALVVSVLVHLLFLILLGLLTLREQAVPEEREIVVPLTFAEPEPPPAPRPQVPPPPPEQEQRPERPEAQDQPEVDRSLLGFSSPEGEVEARPMRPQGPESEIHAPPKPEPGPENAPVAPEPPDEPQELPEPAEPVERTPPADEPPAEPTPQPVQAVPDETPGARDEPARESDDAPRTGDAPLPFPPVPRQEPRRQSRARPDRPDVRRAPDFDIPASGGFWADNLKFDSRDYDWSDYSTKLYFAVYRAWLRELYGRALRFERDQATLQLPELAGEVTIHVTLHRDGHASDIEVLGPSVLPTLDAASVAAIKRAVIPPLPDDFPRDAEGVTWRFRISGFEVARQLQRQLEFMRWKGEF